MKLVKVKSGGFKVQGSCPRCCFGHTPILDRILRDEDGREFGAVVMCPVGNCHCAKILPIPKAKKNR